MTEIILGLVFFAIFLAYLVFPWIHRNQIHILQREMKQLKTQVSQLQEQSLRREVSAPLVSEAPKPTLAPLPTAVPTVLQKAAKGWQPSNMKASLSSTPTPQKPKKEKLGFEQQFGARLPVWIGGIALALAGFYLVKYSIDTGLLTEEVRTILGVLFGIGLLACATWMRSKPGIANGARIAMALSGAGIADLYISIFAATNLYHLISPLMGFVGMGAVTATAVILSLRHGPPIALLGLIGGFLTPALVSSNEPNAALLFMYLYFVLAGLFAVIRKENWWWLAIPTVLGAFLWICLWMVTSFTPADSIWLGLFLIAVSATIAISSKQAMEEGIADVTHLFKLSSAINYLTFGGAAVLMGAIALKSGFGFTEWGLFGLLAAGGITLAYFNPTIYGFVPWVSMVVNAVMLSTWSTELPDVHAGMIVLFAVLYMVSSYLLMWRAVKPASWAGLAAGTAVIYYVIAYFRLHNALGSHWIFSEPPYDFTLPVWGLISLGLALLATYALRAVYMRFPESSDKQRMLAIFAGAATAFVSIGMTVELKREFLSVAFAAQILAISWINTRIHVEALRKFAGVLAGVFAFLLLPQLMLMLQLTAYSLLEAKLHLQDGIPIVNWPLFQLGLPAVFFAGASLLLRKEKDDTYVRGFEVAAIALLAVMGYYLTRHAFHADENILFVKANFIERGVITNVIFLYGLACLVVGRWFQRSAISWSGITLCGVALFRITYFDLFLYNPLFSHQNVGASTLINGLLLPYGLPVAWLILANKELMHLKEEGLLRLTNSFLLVLVFTFVTLNVRQFYHGEFLDQGGASNAEIYTYSVAWLLIGIVLLFLGTLKKNKLARVASLGIMLLTVGKVFLYDASELTGLFRVFSFLGLGICLIGLSWFYTRFVFSDRQVEAH